MLSGIRTDYSTESEMLFMTNHILLECKDICKSFGNNKVLRDINLQIKRGEVHALLGSNGAGKSTLIKIITGVYPKDSGEIWIDGEAADIKSVQDAEKLGIAVIHQDQQMVPLFDVTRNAFLGSEITNSAGIMNLKEMRRQVQEKLEYIQADFEADCLITSLSVGQREQVAIVSALLKDPKILILDEPTASLSSKEITRLFEIIQLLKKSGVTIIYISHHLDEIFRITDRITVLRDSRVQGTMATEDVDSKKIVSMMIGRELKEFYPKEPAEIGRKILEIHDLHSGKMVNGVSLSLRAGEILGLAGLVGAGRTETMLALYGARKVTGGTVVVDGKPYRPVSPLDAGRHGIAFIPEDRRNEGIVAPMSIRENLSLSAVKLWAKHGIISRKAEKQGSDAIMKALDIVCTDRNQAVSELSGGNQQKVVIGRWLIGQYKIFVFDQPTTGVDVGAKTEIYRQMIKLAKDGCGILFLSSENEELLGICDRIAVMNKGKIVKEFESSSATEQDLLYWSTVGEEQEQHEKKE